MMTADEKAGVSFAADSLREPYRDVVVGYYLEGKRAEEIASRLGLTTARIHQIKQRAIRMLRHPLRLEIVDPDGRFKADVFRSWTSRFLTSPDEYRRKMESQEITTKTKTL